MSEARESEAARMLRRARLNCTRGRVAILKVLSITGRGTLSWPTIARKLNAIHISPAPTAAARAA
jgi:Fe2+ or Zn2+ uptake regulation protein